MTPDDFQYPDWDAAEKCHDWKNHVGEHVRAIWDGFTNDQKAAIATDAEELATAEEWD
jgi:hypothetical protein